MVEQVVGVFTVFGDRVFVVHGSAISIATAADKTRLAGHLRLLQANRHVGFGGHLHPGQ